MRVICDCQAFYENMKHLAGVASIAHFHGCGLPDDYLPFCYCPWCGRRLYEVGKKPTQDGEILPEEVKE